MRVSLDVTAVPPHPVGAGRYTIDLAAALARREDVELVLWARRPDGARWAELSPGDSAAATVRAEAPEPRPLRLVWEQVTLPRRLDRSGAEVHHAPHYTMPERARVPVVVTVHDLTFFDHPEWHERTKVPVFRRAIRRAAARADAIVCVSRRTADLLGSRVQPRGPVFVVPHGVDHARFRPEDPSLGSDAGHLAALGVRSPFVLFLGTIEPRKAVPDLVRAFARIAPGRPGLTLVLAGQPGWGAEKVKRAIADEGLAGRVIHTGYVGDGDVPPLLRGAAAVAYPAHEEGFGLPALEALACGAPLVTTAGTAMAEVAGEAALLVPPGSADQLAEAIDATLAGGPEVARRRDMGLAVAANYTWERSAAGHVEAYRAAIAATGSVGDRRSRRSRRSRR